MTDLTADKIKSNWDLHLKLVNTFITGERLEKVTAMLERLQDVMVLAPAATKPYHHNAMVGGYVDHVNRVVQGSLEIKQLWEKMGANINFTDEELVFSALFHDLGKVGDGNVECYVPQSDQWRRDKLQEYFTVNPKLDFMLIQDRSLYLLQKFGIELSQNEYIAIRIHDGVYDEANKAYFVSYNPESKLRSNISYILHQADMLASKVEYDRWKNSSNSSIKSVKKKTNKGTKQVKGSSNLVGLIKTGIVKDL